MAKVITRRRLGEEESSFDYWMTRTPQERLAHVEELRADYYGWTNGTGPLVRKR